MAAAVLASISVALTHWIGSWMQSIRFSPGKRMLPSGCIMPPALMTELRSKPKGPLLRRLAPLLPMVLAGPRGAGASMWSSLSSSCGWCCAAAMRPSMRCMSGRQAGLACQALRIIRVLRHKICASVSMLALHAVARTTSGHLMDWCLPVRALAVWPCNLRRALMLSGVASTP